MAKRKSDPKLGRRWTFLKRRLLRLTQEPLAVEVDYCPLPGILGEEYDLWLGLVVNRHSGDILMDGILDETPTVEDLAFVLAGAMDCPLSHGTSCRPQKVFLRDNPEWEELFPHLKQLGIEVVLTEDILAWDEAVERLMAWLRNKWLWWSEMELGPKADLAVPEPLYKLRGLANWFFVAEQPR